MRSIETEDLQIQTSKTLDQAIYIYQNNTADFAKCLLRAQHQRVSWRAMLTFDAVAARKGSVNLVASP